MSTERVDVLAVMDDAAQVMGRDGNRIMAEARAAVAELIEALDHIGGLTRALRVGGPDPMDLEELSDALRDATDTAHSALARIGAP